MFTETLLNYSRWSLCYVIYAKRFTIAILIKFYQCFSAKNWRKRFWQKAGSYYCTAIILNYSKHSTRCQFKVDFYCAGLLIAIILSKGNFNSPDIYKLVFQMKLYSFRDFLSIYLFVCLFYSCLHLCFIRISSITSPTPKMLVKSILSTTSCKSPKKIMNLL